jgi:hypothetical protein
MLNFNTKMMKIRTLYILTVLTIFQFSCEDKINPEIGSIEPMLVVEGRITTTREPANLRLTMTTNCYEEVDNKGVENALVIISDDQNSQDTLTYQKDGYYKSKSNFLGEIGRTYTLDIYHKNEHYQVIEQLTAVSDIDSVTIDLNIFTDKYLANIFRSIVTLSISLTAVSCSIT